MARPLRTRRGFIFVAAVVSMVVMFIVGTAFLAQASQQLSDALRGLSALHALAMADAGLEYAVWRQKYSGTPVPSAAIYPESTNTRTLSRTTDPASQLRLAFGANGEDQAHVWILQLQPPGTTTGYQVISQGYWRNGTSSLRGIMQGIIQHPIVDPTVVAPPQLKYALFTEADMYVDTSTNVTGDLGSNGSIHLNTSGGGMVTGDVYAAGAVALMKPTTYVDGGVTYGTKIIDRQGKEITATAAPYISGTVAGGGVTQPVPALQRDTYRTWAERFGGSAFLPGSRITSPLQVQTPILYANSANTPGYTLQIDTNLAGPVTIFVNGDINLNGSVVLGGSDKPVVLIATGSVNCSGSPTVNGVVWATGTFGNGTPTAHGSIICNNLAAFQGNAQLSHATYPNAVVIPPNDTSLLDDPWALTSWEVLF